MTEALHPLSTSAVTIVERLDCRFRRMTLISRDEVPGFPCIVTVLRSSFGAGMESENILAGSRRTGDLGREATSFTPCLRKNPLSQLSASLTLSLSHPPYL